MDYKVFVDDPCEVSAACRSGDMDPEFRRARRPEAEAAGAGDAINPAHYKFGDFEAIQICERFGFCRGNAVKYLLRAGRKDPAKTVEDLRKAVWYIQREISGLEEGGDGR